MERGGFSLAPEVIGSLFGGLGLQIDQDDEEFLTALSKYLVPFAGFEHKQVGQRAQHHVTGILPAAVVNLLEVVRVD